MAKKYTFSNNVRDYRPNTPVSSLSGFNSTSSTTSDTRRSGGGANQNSSPNARRSGGGANQNVVTTPSTSSQTASDYFRNNGSPIIEDHGEYNPNIRSQQEIDDVYKRIASQSEIDSGNPGGNPSVGGVGGSSGSISGIGSDIYGRMNSQFQVSQAYLDAMNYTNQLLQQLNSGRTSYTDQINALMDQIMNREKFSYDMSSDQLFQNYLSEMMGSGQTAMRDTMGQASALTGGYGSSYATVAGNQAYNSYIQDAYSNLPDYYNMALSAYESEGNQMLNNLGMLTDADATEYNRLLNSYNANYSNAQQMYSNEYNQWLQDVQNAFNIGSMQNSDYWNRQEMAYKQASRAQSQANSVEEASTKEQEALDKKYNNDDYINSKIQEANAQLQKMGYNMAEFGMWSDEYLFKGEEDVPESVKEKIAKQVIADARSYNSNQNINYTKINDHQVSDGTKTYEMGQIPAEVREALQAQTKGSVYTYKKWGK